jgi:hypothetical protein
MSFVEKLEAFLAVLGVAATLLGGLWALGRVIARGQDAPAAAAEARAEAAEELLATQRHQQVSSRLDALEKDMQKMGITQVAHDKRLGDVERTMATREDIKELAHKIDGLKRDIVTEIAMLLGVSSEP